MWSPVVGEREVCSVPIEVHRRAFVHVDGKM